MIVAFRCSLAAAALTAGSVAMAYPAQVVGNLNLRAGPSGEFPVVRVLYAGLRVEVMGCESDYQWCDIDAEGQRGWANARYLQATFDNRPAILAQDGRALAVPIVAFAIGAYWASHYRDRYWYERRHHWHHWHYHPRPPAWRPPLPAPPRPPSMRPPARPPGAVPPPRPPGPAHPTRPPKRPMAREAGG